MKYKWILRDGKGNIDAGWADFSEVCALISGLEDGEELDVLASPKG